MRRAHGGLLAAIAFCGGLVATPCVQAGSLPDRAALQAFLGGPGTLEDFEKYDIAFGAATGTGTALLDSTSIVNGQGPGLVVPGVAFTFGTGLLQWDGAGYFGSTSKEILSGAPAGQPLTIDFTTLVTAFGVDLRAFSGFEATATMDVYATDDVTLLGSVVGILLPTTGELVFAGWSDLGGIGRVDLTQRDQPWSPIIDNLEFGVTGGVVPEPTSIAMVVTGLIGSLALTRARRRAARQS